MKINNVFVVVKTENLADGFNQRIALHPSKPKTSRQKPCKAEVAKGAIKIALANPIAKDLYLYGTSSRAKFISVAKSKEAP